MHPLRFRPLQFHCLRHMLAAMLAAALLVSGSHSGALAEPALPLAQSQTYHFTLASVAMGFRVPYMVYLPKGYTSEKAYPVWYGLHGNSTTERMWLERAGIGAVADALIESGDIQPLIMVFPLTKYDSAKAIQEDMKDGKRGESQMELFLCNELIPWIEGNYSTIAKPEGRWIGGFSMGGLFALQAAFHHPLLFSKVGAYSPALVFSDFSQGQFAKWLNDGDMTAWLEDPAGYATARGLMHLQVYIDCGTENEPFAEGARSLATALSAMGLAVSFVQHGGGHSLQMDKLASYLCFYAAGMAKEP